MSQRFGLLKRRKGAKDTEPFPPQQRTFSTRFKDSPRGNMLTMVNLESMSPEEISRQPGLITETPSPWKRWKSVHNIPPLPQSQKTERTAFANWEGRQIWTTKLDPQTPFLSAWTLNDGNCYWAAVAMIIYGDGNVWPWVKAQHILWVNQVLSDKNHPRYAVYHYRFMVEDNLARLRNDERTYKGKWTKSETCQVTADLYDICLFLFTAPEGSDSITRHAVRGNWNSPHRFMMFVNDNHYEACRPLVTRISEYRVPRIPNEIQTDWTSDGIQYEIEVPNVLHYDRQPRFGKGPPKVYEQLIPRPVIPLPSVKDLHLAIGAKGDIPRMITPNPAEKPILVQTFPITSHKPKDSKGGDVTVISSSSSDDDEKDSDAQRKKSRRDQRAKMYSSWSRSELRAKAKELKLNVFLYHKKDASSIIQSILNEKDDQDERDGQVGWWKSRIERIRMYSSWPIHELGDLVKSFFLIPSDFQLKEELISAVLTAQDAAESEISAKVREGQELRTWTMYMGFPKANLLFMAENFKIRYHKTWCKEMLADALTTRRAVMNGYYTDPPMGVDPKTPAKVLEERERLTLATYMKTPLSDLRRKMDGFNLPYGEDWEINNFADALTAYDREHDSLLPYDPPSSSPRIGVLAKTNEDPEIFDRGMPTEIQLEEFRTWDTNWDVEDYGDERSDYYKEHFSAEELELERAARNLSEGGETLQMLVWDDKSKLLMAKRRSMGLPVRLQLKRKHAPEKPEAAKKRSKKAEKEELNSLIDPHLRRGPEWTDFLDSMVKFETLKRGAESAPGGTERGRGRGRGRPRGQPRGGRKGGEGRGK